MPGMFDGFQLNIFDDAIFDTKIQAGRTIRQITSPSVPPTNFSVRVVDV